MNKITLKVNEKEIPLNEFVQRVFLNTVGGLVDSLDKIPDEKHKIEVLIE